MNLRRSIIFAVLLIGTLFIQGCGVLLHQLDNTSSRKKEFDLSRSIKISSTPAGAEVYAENNYIGKTPLSYTAQYKEIQEWKEKGKSMLIIGTALDLTGAVISGFAISATKTHSTANYICIASLIGLLGASVIDVALLSRDAKSEKIYKFEPNMLKTELRLSGYKTESLELELPKKLKDINLNLVKKDENNTDSAPVFHGCSKDTDCKGERICVKGECQWPSK